jgi:hypothetical protein
MAASGVADGNPESIISFQTRPLRVIGICAILSCPFEGESNMHKHLLRPTEESGRYDLDEPIRASDRNHIPATITAWGLVVLVFGCYFGVLLLAAH